MARFQHGDHDSTRALSVQVVNGADKRSPKRLVNLHIGKVATVTMTLAEARSLREGLNAMRSLDEPAPTATSADLTAMAKRSAEVEDEIEAAKLSSGT